MYHKFGSRRCISNSSSFDINVELRGVLYYYFLYFEIDHLILLLRQYFHDYRLFVPS